MIIDEILADMEAEGDDLDALVSGIGAEQWRLPTPSPGWKWVPRWRTMIVPACTSVPLYTFTPSRCAFESRPLREDAAPFFFDMVRSPTSSRPPA